LAAQRLDIEKGKKKLDEAIHRGKTELFVTDTLKFLREDVLPRLHDRMNRPTCEACGFQRDHKEERWALQEGVDIGKEILAIYARAKGVQKDELAEVIEVAEWPSEGAKS